MISLAGRLLAMARSVETIPEATIEFLNDTRLTLKDHHIEGLTEN